MPDGDDDLGDSDKDCHHRELTLARIAARQLGVVTHKQLYELGFTYWQIRRRLVLGRLHSVHHNVYAVEFRVAHDLAGILRDLYHFLEVV
jgi:hypothetical protein